MGKTKIVLDADVIIHFAKGNLLHLLPSICKNYDHAILSTVYAEVKEPLKSQLNNQIHFLKNIHVVDFKPTGEMLKEYARLNAIKGKGESACLAYCRFNHDVIGSSNLKDTKEYCDHHKITYLTTIDFLYFAIREKLITTKEANNFIFEVRAQGSKLPDVDMKTFRSGVLI